MIPEYEDLSRKDDLDQASGLTMRLNADAEREVRSRVAPEKYPDGNGGFYTQVVQPDGTFPIPYCVDCEDPIPQVRLEMGRVRCTACQERKENARKR